jgi:subtilisin family serine protease
VKRTIVILTLVGVLVLACSGMVLAQSAAPGNGEQQAAVEKSAGQAVPGRYIVVLRDDANARNVAEEDSRQLGAEVTSVYQHALRGYAAKIPSARLAEVKSDPRVLFVQPDSTAVAFGPTMPTGVNRIDAESSTTAKIDGIDGIDGSDQRVNANVAVIDTGINKTHPDLNVKGGRNFATFFSPSNNFEDGHGHGTHVAGTIAALDNSNGAVGVAPGAKLYGVKVLSNSGTGYQSWIIKGIDWVTGRKAEFNDGSGDGDPGIDFAVANMSLGGSGTDGSCGSNAYHKAICNSVAAGVTYTVAAGNSNANFQNFVPATYSEVLTVTAVSDSDGVSGGQGAAPSCRTGEKDDFPATFSNYATPLTSDQNPLTSDQNHTIAAPGVCIYSTWKNGGYNTISGTSMASPHVAGAAALYKANHPTATPTAVMTQLRGDASASAWAQSNGFTGDPLHSPIAGRYYGYLTHVDGY